MVSLTFESCIYFQKHTIQYILTYFAFIYFFFIFSDIWSLGCVLYELATLTSPFKEENLKMFELFQKIVKCEYKPLPDNFSEDLRYMTSCKLIIERDRERRASWECSCSSLF